jgi:hypothetical protein
VFGQYRFCDGTEQSVMIFSLVVLLCRNPHQGPEEYGSTAGFILLIEDILGNGNWYKTENPKAAVKENPDHLMI